jgi:hypothetical protein
VKALALFFLALGAQAADRDYCRSLAELEKATPDCSQNDNFVDAMAKCLLKLGTEIREMHARQLGEQMGENGAKAAAAQDARVANSSADLEKSLATLDVILGKAQRARWEGVRYSKNFTWPGPLSDETVAELELRPLLVTIPCYADNQKALREKILELDRKIGELKRAKADTTALHSRDKDILKGLGSGTDLIPAAPAGRSPASVPVTPKKAGWGNSDISGEIKKEKLD